VIRTSDSTAEFSEKNEEASRKGAMTQRNDKDRCIELFAALRHCVIRFLLCRIGWTSAAVAEGERERWQRTNSPRAPRRTFLKSRLPPAFRNVLWVAVKHGKFAPALARWVIREQPVAAEVPILPVRRYVPSFRPACRH
jgi:hypothetical protein